MRIKIKNLGEEINTDFIFFEYFGKDKVKFIFRYMHPETGKFVSLDAEDLTYIVDDKKKDCCLYYGSE